jgi:hypothetical protein
VYSRIVDGQETTFGVSGKLIRNVLVMYDRRTESLWSQLLGEAVAGELEGTKLDYLPSVMTTWQEWKAQHPDTLALVKGTTSDSDPYDGYYASNRAGVIGETFQDERLPTKQFVVGVVLGDQAVSSTFEAVAYPFSVLSLEPVVNDVVAGTPVLVVFGQDNVTSAVFSREVEGQTLTFSLEDTESLTLTDAETGSTWRGLTGEATDGPLVGQRLEQLKSTNSFWFGWKDFYPDTRVYGLEE